MSIASEITRLQGVKSNILDAIAAKGVSVPSGAKLADCPELIRSISGGGIHQTFVKKELLGKQYDCVEIDSGVFFPIQNLDYIDNNIIMTNSFPSSSNVPAVAYYGYEADGDGLFYNVLARSYVNSIKPSYAKNLSQAYFDKLVAYITDLIRSLAGAGANCDNETKSTFVKDFSFSPYENALGLINLGISVYGCFDGRYWTKYPYEYNKPVYFGITSSPTGYGEMFNIQYGKTLNYYNSSLGETSCYPVRFIIDEN